MQHILVAIISYFAGSIPFSYLIPKLAKNIDVTKTGSKNAGFTNATRAAGIKLSLFALLGDVLKGFAPVFITYKILGSVHMAAFAGLFAVVGHCFSCFLKFNSGKGVATAAGVVFALNPYLGLTLMAMQLITMLVSNYMSFASMLSAAILPVLASFFCHVRFPAIIYISVLAAIVFIRHIPNLKRLIAGEEKKLFTRKKRR